jgi:vacuolar-type H+-ATPase subunit E/Vma4
MNPIEKIELQNRLKRIENNQTLLNENFAILGDKLDEILSILKPNGK